MKPKPKLGGALIRVARAGEHLAELMRRIEALRQEQHDAITWDFDPECPDEIKAGPTRYVEVPLVLSVIVGEICYNLRAALDYLVYELAILDSGAINEGTQFPIEDKPKGFAWRQKRGWLNGINAAHVAAIERLQPYSGCNWTRTLRDISNPDKHRELVTSQGSFELAVFPAAERLRFLDIPGRESSAINPVTGKEVHVKTDLSLEIQFSDGTPVVETLEKLASEVARVLEAFKPEFQSNVNGPRNLSSLGRAKFPSLAGLVISRWRDRRLHAWVGGRGAWAAASMVEVGSEPLIGCAQALCYFCYFSKKVANFWYQETVHACRTIVDRKSCPDD